MKYGVNIEFYSCIYLVIARMQNIALQVENPLFQFVCPTLNDEIYKY